MLIQTILDVIDPFILLAIGIALIAFEALIASFILIWFGVGFVVIAIVSSMYMFSDGIWQIAAASIISLLLLFLLRKKVLEKFLPFFYGCMIFMGF